MPANSVQLGFGGGPDMKGSWKNYRTGEVINIRDTVIEDNQIIGITTTGQQVPLSRLQTFVKLDRPEPDQRPQEPKQTHPTPVRTPTPQRIDVDLEDFGDIDTGGYEILPEDMELLKDTKSSLPVRERHTVPASTQQPFQVASKPLVDPAITKVLDGLSKKECPKVSFDVKWDSLPEGVIFLKKYLGIDEEDLVKAVLDKFIDVDEIKLKLQIQLAQIIEDGLNPKTPKESKKETKKSKEVKETKE